VHDVTVANQGSGNSREAVGKKARLHEITKVNKITKVQGKGPRQPSFRVKTHLSISSLIVRLGTDELALKSLSLGD